MISTSETRPLTSRVLKTEPLPWKLFQFIQPENFKDLPAEAGDKLRRSIQENQFTQPFYVWVDLDQDTVRYYCLDGFHRIKILKDLEAEGYEIPQLLPATLIHCESMKEAAHLVLQFSSMYAKITEEGFMEFVQEFDLDLPNLSQKIDLPDISFYLTVPDRLLELQEDEFNEEEALGQIIQPYAKTGDIFKLGEHILICGDSQDLFTLRNTSLLNHRHVQLIYCDPPYNISYNYEKGSGSTEKKYTNQTFSDSLDHEKYYELISSTLYNALSFCPKDAHVFYWCDESYVGLIQDVFKSNNVTNRRVCFWIKERLNPVPQVAFNKVIEPCVYGTIGSPELNPEFTNLTEVWNTGMNESHNLDDLLSLAQLWFVQRDDTNLYQHPTTKPIKLHEKPLKRCSRQGDTIMDLFGGSGSTLIACEQLNRKSILVEKDPVFCDLIIRRYTAYCEKRGFEVKFNHENGPLTLNNFRHANQPVR
jgi:DNA modification methylase